MQGSKLTPLESGITLYQMVDGKPVPCDEETTKRYLDEFRKLSPEEHRKLRESPIWVPESVEVRQELARKISMGLVRTNADQDDLDALYGTGQGAPVGVLNCRPKAR